LYEAALVWRPIPHLSVTKNSHSSIYFFKEVQSSDCYNVINVAIKIDRHTTNDDRLISAVMDFFLLWKLQDAIAHNKNLRISSLTIHAMVGLANGISLAFSQGWARYESLGWRT
jgi:hypothetical protein